MLGDARNRAGREASDVMDDGNIKNKNINTNLLIITVVVPLSFSTKHNKSINDCFK